VKDNVNRGVEHGEVTADGLAHATPDTVAIDGLAHRFADSESNARSDGVCSAQWRAVGTELRAQKKEVGHLLCKLFAAGFVDPLEVGVFAKTEGGGIGSHTAGLDAMDVESRMNLILLCAAGR
jgi:hypothetical protein